MTLTEYLQRLAKDLHTANDVLGKISQASQNPKISQALDTIANRLSDHAKQVDKMVEHTITSANDKQPHEKRFLGDDPTGGKTHH